MSNLGLDGASHIVHDDADLVKGVDLQYQSEAPAQI